MRADSLWQLMALACGVMIAGEDGSAVAEYMETVSSGPMFDGNVLKDYSAFTVSEDWVGMGMDYYEFWTGRSYGETDITFLNRRAVYEDNLHFIDGVSYLYNGLHVTGSWCWVNAQEFMEHFSFEGALSVLKSDDSYFFWMIV